ncbi:MAG: AmmeMemoRadiSam system protein A [Gammaproteobacteria bacterium]
MLDASDRRALLEIARRVIEGRSSDRETGSSAATISAALNQPRASFVTLKRDDQLRGCIGTLEPVRRLSDDVAYNAHAAAFRDPRFPPLARHETPLVQIEISVLGRPEALDVADRDELLKCLRPAMDGLIVGTGSRRATFLPSVWESLSDPDEFVAHLWRKAGLRPDDWPSDIRLQRYTAEHFDEHTADV